MHLRTWQPGHGIEPNDFPSLQPQLKRVIGLTLLQIVDRRNVVRCEQLFGTNNMAGDLVQMIKSIVGHLPRSLDGQTPGGEIVEAGRISTCGLVPIPAEAVAP